MMNSKKCEYKWLYTALGDSITVGKRSSKPIEKGYVNRYSNMIQRKYHACIAQKNYAQNGFTSAEIYRFMTQEHIMEAVERSSIITLTAGGNDLIQAGMKYFTRFDEEPLSRALMRCQKNLTKILNAIHEVKRNDPNPYIIRICNLYNPYFKLDRSIKWVKLYNKHIKKFEAYPNVKVADLYHAFLGREKELLSWDSIHPNDKGYSVIAKTLYKLGIDELIKNHRS